MGAKYPARGDAMITQDMRARIEAVAELPAARSAGLGLSDVIREALAAGLPAVEATWRGDPPPVTFVPPQ